MAPIQAKEGLVEGKKFKPTTVEVLRICEPQVNCPVNFKDGQLAATVSITRQQPTYKNYGVYVEASEGITEISYPDPAKKGGYIFQTQRDNDGRLIYQTPLVAVQEIRLKRRDGKTMVLVRE